MTALLKKLMVRYNLQDAICKLLIQSTNSLAVSLQTS